MIKIKPRFLPRNLMDAVSTSMIGLLQVLILFILPSLGVYFASHNLGLTIFCFLALYLTFLLFTVWDLKISEKGIKFNRVLGSPKFIEWNQIHSIEPAPSRELIIQGWLWPPFPAREMTTSLTNIGHYRIAYNDAHIYFPPKDSAAFERHIKRKNINAF